MHQRVSQPRCRQSPRASLQYPVHGPCVAALAAPGFHRADSQRAAPFACRLCQTLGNTNARVTCLRSAQVAAAERGGNYVAGCSPFGSQRTDFAPRSGWRAADGGNGCLALSSTGSKVKVWCSSSPVSCLLLPATPVAGCPSFGGQRTGGGGSITTFGGRSGVRAVVKRRKPSRAVVHPRQRVALVDQPAASVLPNPSVKRTGLRPAAYLKR